MQLHIFLSIAIFAFQFSLDTKRCAAFTYGTALVNNWRLITENERHLQRIPGLIVENWVTYE